MADMKNATMGRINGRAVVILEAMHCGAKVRFVNSPMDEWFLTLWENIKPF